MGIKLIAVDMDGTLLDDDKNISLRNKESIQEAIKTGIVVMLASGRAFAGVKRYADYLDLKVPLVIYNGAAVIESKSQKVFYEKPIKIETARSIIRYCGQKGYHIQTYANDKFQVFKHNSFSENYFKVFGIEEEILGNSMCDITITPYKMLVIANDENFQSVRNDLEQKFSKQIDFSSSMLNYLEMVELGVNKWSAVKSVGAMYGIAPTDIMCIGDNNNDYSMIKNAGIGVAMGNSNERILKIAKIITAKNTENGVAAVIDKVLYNKL
jgi:hypothetical protein